MTTAIIFTALLCLGFAMTLAGLGLITVAVLRWLVDRI